MNRLSALWIESPIGLYVGRIEIAHILRFALFIAIFLLPWISLQPFANLGDATIGDAAEGRGLTYASFGFLAVLSLVLVMRRHAEALRSFVSTPYILFGSWICINLVMSRDPGASTQRFVLTACVFVVAATVLLLPATARELNRWLGAAVLSFLAVCYLGVMVAPGFSIHQATDVAEYHLAGDWRGVFDHKNTASAVMAMLVFVGIYLMRSGAVLVGPLVTALAVVFLFFTRGKSATALVILILVLAELVAAARTFRVRAVLCYAPLIVLNLLSIGTVVSPTLSAIGRSLPFDTSFTGRDEVWKFAFASIAQRPIFGYGYFAFWGSDFVRDADPGESIHEWVVIASHSHNGYLDSALTLGIPGLLFMMAILVVAPLRDYDLAEARGQGTPLGKMFLRIWLFGIYLASLESFFLDRADPVWFTFLVSVIGLHYVSRFRTA
ncbi:O-antigen ligase family protein [Bradyrhizobium sediminis]|uniref:O-antigen ligase family protein n=1 Tax=Bradyrhizobium sediminis TaxID=2840469 RepID=A0A975NRU5_9BRAD|nr:O-antigen ligase [Bradyrhizobium sediminis]QWG19521.1 O-antigen ligase family protein [Bradyrhizobium sediminis]